MILTASLCGAFYKRYIIVILEKTFIGFPPPLRGGWAVGPNSLPIAVAHPDYRLTNRSLPFFMIKTFHAQQNTLCFVKFKHAACSPDY